VPPGTWWLARRDGNLSHGLNIGVWDILGMERHMKTARLVLVLAKNVRPVFDPRSEGVDKVRPVSPSVYAILGCLLVGAEIF
jgi:hypothetical protein